MDAGAATPGSSKVAVWIGRIMSALIVLMLLMSAGFKLAKSEDVVKGFDEIGWNVKMAVALGILEIACALLYAIPQTSVLGAILVTGYLGGAIATHVRLEQPFFVQTVIGVLVWLALFLREPRLRAILPLRT